MRICLDDNATARAGMDGRHSEVAVTGAAAGPSSCRRQNVSAPHQVEIVGIPSMFSFLTVRFRTLGPSAPNGGSRQRRDEERRLSGSRSLGAEERLRASGVNRCRRRRPHGDRPERRCRFRVELAGPRRFACRDRRACGGAAIRVPAPPPGPTLGRREVSRRSP